MTRIRNYKPMAIPLQVNSMNSFFWTPFRSAFVIFASSSWIALMRLAVAHLIWNLTPVMFFPGLQYSLKFWLEQGVSGFGICDTDATYSEKVKQTSTWPKQDQSWVGTWEGLCSDCTVIPPPSPVRSWWSGGLCCRSSVKWTMNGTYFASTKANIQHKKSAHRPENIRCQAHVFGQTFIVH